MTPAEMQALAATLVTAILIVPFAAEWFAAKMPAAKSGEIKRSAAFYWLTPLLGIIVFASFAAVTARPLMALAGSLLFFGGLTAVSNKKYEVLKDPFNAHDFDNLRNLYIYPEFYISYVGWPVLLLIIALFGTGIGLSVYFEPPFAFYAAWPPYAGWAGILVAWFVFLRIVRQIATSYFNETTAPRFGVTLELQNDVARFGLFPTVLLYRLLLKAKIDKVELRERPLTATASQDTLNDIIAIQGESYFDLERLFKCLPDGAQQAWKPVRALEKAGVHTGRIDVPCWGAYTMQTEFSFLSALKNDTLGIDRINPYMRFSQKQVSTIARALKDAGYRTLCVHPAKKEFFRRSDVMPNLGFDDFIGLEAFEGAAIYGKYIGDAALADKIDAIVKEHHATSQQPLFIFAITIESHGPWAEGRLARHLDEKTLIRNNPTGDGEFARYQKHMENLLRFYERLSTGSTAERPRTVALYGDHMPALGTLFNEHGFDDKRVDYLLWNSNKPVTPKNDMCIENFGDMVLAEAGLTLNQPANGS